MRKTVAAAVMGAALLAVAMPASAQAGTQAAPDCQHNSGYGVIVKTAPVSALSDGSRLGTVELCRDSAYNYWGFVIYRSPMTASEYAQVYLQTFRDGSWVSDVTCDTAVGTTNGGNRHVGPGETRCWTSKVSGVSGHYTFRAWSDKISSHTGALLATGHTVIAR